MAFYYKDIDNTIFQKYSNKGNIDELVIISGYIGPEPVSRLKHLNLKTRIIAGMYSNGINKHLYDSLDSSVKQNGNLTIYYSKIDVHSKIYIWLEKNSPKYILMGSANFSNNGLQTNYRESLCDVDLNNSKRLMDYFKQIINQSTKSPKITVNNKKVFNSGLIINSNSVTLPLYSNNKKMRNYVPTKSGLNWGSGSSNGHTSTGDAYIAIPVEVIKKLPNFFNPFDIYYKSKSARLRKSEPIEIIWDDGHVMQASLEGKQVVNGISYPKQIASYSNKTRKQLGHGAKSILGRYLRKRMNIPLSKTIEYKDLINYGRTSINITKVSDGVYTADFS
ncbi:MULTISPECIES: restriction endonuclease PLD domain-containing protein [Apilactobacillus]|uniref:NgoFVII family restriction endonuclease n=1 Tax=Apilactobacillus micheneri TaxID=1899430 RepID=A0A9Q8ILQ7_9LACO|nr:MULTISPECIES: restriction endonuclease PLD domain-containing protein [Apilactobacillus]TPR15882.1 NgoFVII family restriction endonuclease [Apilactobacillus timberlakei]TPR37596.1 NgoFVII family restriction endonuclease [Apilactobacillus micheneri]TPR38727.1 NgoFVII family restriction endonuclease [Apilactobacillus micheneri]TPR42331.1 NgoFVII family restriction endonuclease [Apilactobacillus micheneri]TPR42395.1 NgoFVII family restriction endonuclease [Apilactobacillus micheneri]